MSIDKVFGSVILHLVSRMAGADTMNMKDRHVIEAMGMTRVVIENGRVTEVGEPIVTYCPLYFKYRDIKEIAQEAVRENIQFRVDDFGMCTPKRQLRMKDFLSFGISEVLAMCVEDGTLDCGVIVCDGAGTVVISDPEVIQGIGGRISGIVETSPIPAIIEEIGEERVLDPANARIDQVEGVKLARKLGYDRIGITVAVAEDAESIRRIMGENATIFAVHTTGVSREDAEILFECCDLVTACASQAVRDIGEERSLLTVGSKIPIYASTEFGADIMRRRLERIGRSRSNANSEIPDPPRPLI